ncbi:hypothetical protein E4K67_12170 [Desulfosporosinus fructosivorans]|uniref:Uncharacterized protein n=1 Tax=Desulfosporosinus fructosivorans TaxID=2018669 RepID=A0A4Z0R5T0_9FIRM|nr:RES domain-containing protein [Desulfosporosinus fructosivorans]TGE37503.1 hypothetical protein E4K67_12170 [Desulfosporosinus fructosivorans]
MQKMNEKDLTEKIKQLSKLDLSKVDITIDYLKMQIGEVIEPLLEMVIGANFPKVYRARINEDKKSFPNIKDLWYPDKEKIKKLGRFNAIHEQMFYCGTHQLIATSEINAQVGDVVSVMECELKEPKRKLKVPNIFLNDYKSIPGISVNVEPIEKHNKAHSILKTHENIKKFTLIQKFLESESLKKVRIGEEYNYKISVIVKEILFARGDLDGLCYPSIAVDKEGINIVLSPDAIDKYYFPTKVLVFEKILINNEEYFQLINQSTLIDSTSGSIMYEL